VTAPRRRHWLATCALGLVVAFALACEESSSARAPTIEEGARVRAESQAAALRGADWMIRNADALPKGWGHPFLSRIARIVDDPARQQALQAALARNARSAAHPALPDPITAQDLLTPKRITPILAELTRRRDLALDIAGPIAQLQAVIDANQVALIEQLPPTQAVAFVHLFDGLGLTWGLDLDTLIRRAQITATLKPRPKLAENRQYLYTLTHLILARAHYFANSVDPQEFIFSLPIFEAALIELLAQPADPFSLDLQSEILMSYQLLGAQEPDAALATRRFLIARQHPNGSWGKTGPAHRRNVHVTASAIYGLSAYPERLRPGSAP
jgi:hypothetical protein